jgi:hypothetical protein
MAENTKLGHTLELSAEDIRVAVKYHFSPIRCPRCRFATGCANCGGTGRVWLNGRGSLSDAGIRRLRELDQESMEGFPLEPRRQAEPAGVALAPSLFPARDTLTSGLAYTDARGSQRATAGDAKAVNTGSAELLTDDRQPHANDGRQHRR